MCCCDVQVWSSLVDIIRSHLRDGDRAHMVGVVPESHGLGHAQEMSDNTHQDHHVEDLMR